MHTQLQDITLKRKRGKKRIPSSTVVTVNMPKGDDTAHDIRQSQHTQSHRRHIPTTAVVVQKLE